MVSSKPATIAVGDGNDAVLPQNYGCGSFVNDECSGCVPPKTHGPLYVGRTNLMLLAVYGPL